MTDATKPPPDPSTLRAKCPACGEQLWRQRAGEWSLRAAIVKLREDGALVARCPVDRCRGELELPWLALQVPPPPPRRRFVVRRDPVRT